MQLSCGVFQVFTVPFVSVWTLKRFSVSVYAMLDMQFWKTRLRSNANRLSGSTGRVQSLQNTISKEYKESQNMTIFEEMIGSKVEKRSTNKVSDLSDRLHANKPNQNL